MSAPDGPLPPLAPGARGIPDVDTPPGYGPPAAPWAAEGRRSPAGAGSGPALFPAIGWWGFGLSFASLLPPLAGAALALSIVGIIQARAAGRLLAPPVIGASIAALALALHLVVGAATIVGAVVEAGEAAAQTSSEEDFLDALALDAPLVYRELPDDDLVEEGYDACLVLAEGGTRLEAASSLGWIEIADGYAVVDAATGTLCESTGEPLVG